MRHLSTFHVGAQGAYDDESDRALGFIVKGATLQKARRIYLSLGTKVILREYFLLQTGSVFSPNFKVIYSVGGALGYISWGYYDTWGTLQQSYSSMFSIKSTLVLPKLLFYLVTATAQSFYSGLYLLQSTILANYRHKLWPTGYLEGGVRFYFKSRGRVIAKLKKAIKISGSIVDGKKYYTKTQGVIQGSKRMVLVVKATLNSKWRSILYSVKGLSSAPFYVARIPVKLQQFITNKRWFR